MIKTISSWKTSAVKFKRTSFIKYPNREMEQRQSSVEIYWKTQHDFLGRKCGSGKTFIKFTTQNTLFEINLDKKKHHIKI